MREPLKTALPRLLGTALREETVHLQPAPEATMSKKPITVYRSAVTGRIVKPTYAKTHPKTTEKETYKR